ncbi:hypothetical protein BDZ91DRAFT_716920 [Kalaharituber pfeilii]|nr:hypothetical protein BDZ91DRAFT_716920 [Kalaharituber pfeilii]
MSATQRQTHHKGVHRYKLTLTMNRSFRDLSEDPHQLGYIKKAFYMPLVSIILSCLSFFFLHIFIYFSCRDRTLVKSITHVDNTIAHFEPCGWKW